MFMKISDYIIEFIASLGVENVFCVTGGGAMLYGLDELIRRETDIPTALAEDAMSCVAIGCGMALDSFSKFDGKAKNVKTGH